MTLSNILLLCGLAVIWKYSCYQIALGVFFVALATHISVMKNIRKELKNENKQKVFNRKG